MVVFRLPLLFQSFSNQNDMPDMDIMFKTHVSAEIQQLEEQQAGVDSHLDLSGHTWGGCFRARPKPLTSGCSTPAESATGGLISPFHPSVNT